MSAVLSISWGKKHQELSIEKKKPLLKQKIRKIWPQLYAQ